MGSANLVVDISPQDDLAVQLMSQFIQRSYLAIDHGGQKSQFSSGCYKFATLHLVSCKLLHICYFAPNQLLANS